MLFRHTLSMTNKCNQTRDACEKECFCATLGLSQIFFFPLVAGVQLYFQFRVLVLKICIWFELRYKKKRTVSKKRNTVLTGSASSTHINPAHWVHFTICDCDTPLQERDSGRESARERENTKTNCSSSINANHFLQVCWWSFEDSGLFFLFIFLSRSHKVALAELKTLPAWIGFPFFPPPSFFPVILSP